MRRIWKCDRFLDSHDMIKENAVPQFWGDLPGIVPAISHKMRLKKDFMTILVFSDSHSSLGFMRRCMETVRPDGVIHLGDYFDNGEVIREENPGIPFYQVPGNCDRYRCPPDQPEILIDRIFGVDFYLTHGH